MALVISAKGRAAGMKRTNVWTAAGELSASRGTPAREGVRPFTGRALGMPRGRYSTAAPQRRSCGRIPAACDACQEE